MTFNLTSLEHNTLDTDKQTESFKVPAHNDVDGRKILHDLKAVSLSLN